MLQVPFNMTGTIPKAPVECNNFPQYEEVSGAGRLKNPLFKPLVTTGDKRYVIGVAPPSLGSTWR